MSRPNNSKMLPICGQNVARFESLGDSCHGRIHKTKRKVAIRMHDVGDPWKILVVEMLDDELTVRDSANERFLCCGPNSLLQEITHLGQDRHRQNNVPRRATPPVTHSAVPGVARINQREDCARIGNDGHA